MVADTRELSVLMNDIFIGTLKKSSRLGLTFAYNNEWLSLDDARPISLSLPLISKIFSGDVVANFFENLLPDNPQIRARIQARFHVKTNQAFDLLENIGRDCVGAIQLIAPLTKTPTNKIDYEPLTDQQIAVILQDYKNAPLGMSDDFDDFRISIAGAQEKTGLLYYKDRWCRPIDATPTSHIFKLPIGFIPEQQIDLTDSCENEWLCMKIAAAFGLEVTNCEIAYFNGVKTLVVKRFDRRLSSDGTWLMRIPQEDMCQALAYSPHLKYQANGGPGIHEIMQLLLGSQTPQQDRDNFFRAQVVFWCLAAIDGHAKNFSVHIETRGGYRLTPLYNIMSAYPLIAKKQLQQRKIKMAMALQGKNNHCHWYGIQYRHFIETAKKINYSVKQAELIIDEVLEKMTNVIDTVSNQLPNAFPTDIAQTIFDGMLGFKKEIQKTSLA